MTYPPSQSMERLQTQIPLCAETQSGREDRCRTVRRGLHEQEVDEPRHSREGWQALRHSAGLGVVGDRVEPVHGGHARLPGCVLRVQHSVLSSQQVHQHV